MITHLVLFRPRADLPSADRQALAHAFAAALSVIPSIKSVRIGPRVTHGRGYEQLMTVDYSFAVAIEFDDVAGLTAYLEHPVHETLAARFFASIDQALMYDFEMRDGEAGLAALIDPESTRA